MRESQKYLLYPDGHLWLAMVSGSAMAARVTMVRRTITAKLCKSNLGNKGKKGNQWQDGPSLQKG